MKNPIPPIFFKIGIAAVVSAISYKEYRKYEIKEKIRKSEYFNEALNVLKTNKSIHKLMGAPIEEVGFSLSGSLSNFIKDKSAQLAVNIEGPTDKGIMFFWAKLDDQNRWQIDRLELELNNTPGRMTIIPNEILPEITKENPIENKKNNLLGEQTVDNK